MEIDETSPGSVDKTDPFVAAFVKVKVALRDGPAASAHL